MHCEELIDIIEKNCGLKAPYCLTVYYKCNSKQKELDEEYMGWYAPRQMMNDSLYGQISYNSVLSDAFKFKLGHNLKGFLVEMKAATGKDIPEHVIRPAKVFPPRVVTVSYAPLLMGILRRRKDPMQMKEWWIRRQVGKRLIVVLM